MFFGQNFKFIKVDHTTTINILKIFVGRTWAEKTNYMHHNIMIIILLSNIIYIYFQCNKISKYLWLWIMRLVRKWTFSWKVEKSVCFFTTTLLHICCWQVLGTNISVWQLEIGNSTIGFVLRVCSPVCLPTTILWCIFAPFFYSKHQCYWEKHSLVKGLNSKNEKRKTHKKNNSLPVWLNHWFKEKLSILNHTISRKI